MIRNHTKLLKNKKGGLSQLLSVVLLLIITVFIFISAIHPNGKAVDNVGKDSVTAIENEQTQLEADAVPTMPEMPNMP